MLYMVDWNTWWAEYSKRTYLPSNDWGPHNQQHQLVKQRVKESNHRLQLGGVERCDAGLQFSLQVVFHDAHISYPDREHMLIQSVYQGKELVQILVLKSEMGLSMQIKRGKQDTYFSFLFFPSCLAMEANNRSSGCPCSGWQICSTKAELEPGYIFFKPNERQYSNIACQYLLNQEELQTKHNINYNFNNICKIPLSCRSIKPRSPQFSQTFSYYIYNESENTVGGILIKH